MAGLIWNGNYLLAILHNKTYSVPKKSGAAALYAAFKERGLEITLEMWDKLQQQENEYDVSPREMLDLGQHLLSNKQLTAAAAVFGRLATALPQSAICQALLGEAHLQLEQRQEAAKCFGKALSLEPNNPYVRSKLKEIL